MKKYIFIFLIIILSFWAILPLLHTGFFPMHDDQQIARLYELDLALKGGQFPPRWVSNLGFGYGYPLFNFYPPLVYYLGEIFHLLGFSLITSVKIVMGLSFILSGFAMFKLTKKFVGPELALLASILYIYAPYRSLDVYVRGALAESFAFVFYPLILLNIKNITEKPNLKNLLFLSLSAGGLILTHSLMVFPFAIFASIFYFYQFYQNKNNKLKILLFTINSSLLTFGLTAYFSLPSILEKKYTLVDTILTKELANYKLHFVYLRQLVSSPWGYGGSIYGLLDGISFEIGKIHLVLLGFGLLIFLVNFLKNKKDYLKNIFCLLPFAFCLVLSIYLPTFHSQFLWNLISPLWYIQFPWRFLSFTALFLPLVIVFLINSLKLSDKVITFITFISFIAVILYNRQYFAPARYLDVNDQTYTTKEDLSWRVSKTSFEFVPIGVKTVLSDIGTTQLDINKNEIPTQSYQILKGDLKVSEIKNLPHQKIYQIKSSTGGILQINTYHFPGWIAAIDGKSTLINDKNKLKLITIVVPPGEHEVIVQFTNTPVRLIGNILSISATIIIVFSLLYLRIKI